MKRALRLLLTFCILALALPTVGCGSQGLFAPTPEPVTLRVAFRDGTVDLQDLADQYHEDNPNVTIELIAAQRFGNQLRDQVRSGNVDIFRAGLEGLEYIDGGYIVPFDDIQLQDWTKIKDDYYEGVWEGMQVSGQQWGVPAGIDTFVTYANVNQALALDVTLPEGQWDMFQFLDLANSMNYPEGLPYNDSGYLWGFCSDPTTYSFDPVILAYLYGGQIVDDLGSPTTATLDDPLTIEATQWYSDLANRYMVMPQSQEVKRRFSRGGVFEAQIRGGCALWLGMYSNRGGLDSPYKWTVEWKMLPLPTANEPMTLGLVEGYFVTKDCENRQEALEFLRYLSDHWESSGQFMPPRLSQIQSDEYQEAVGEDVANVFTDSPAELVILPGGLSPVLERVGEVYLRSVIEIVTQDLDAGMVLEEAQDSLRGTY